MALVLASLCFVFINTLPGDMALRIAVARYGLDLISADLVEQVRTEANLQEGMARQYLRWMGQALHQQTATLDLPNPHRNMTCPAPWFASPMAIP